VLLSAVSGLGVNDVLHALVREIGRARGKELAEATVDRRPWQP
jgi:hypothetical protein